MKNKKLFIALTAVFSVVIFLATFLLVWYCAAIYPDFKSFEKGIEIPGLKDGAIPQGMGSCKANYEVKTTGDDGVVNTTNKVQTYFFVSAYMNDKSPSRIYVTGEDTGYVGYVTLKTESGEDFYGHCGGVAINNNPTSTYYNYYTLWVTGEGRVYCAKPSEEAVKAKKTIAQEIIEKAAENGSIQFTSSFNANCNASFCYYYDDPSQSSITYDRLYVGEFYRAGNYETDKTHRLKTPNGYQNTAFMYEYSVNTSSKFGLTTLGTNDNVSGDNVVPKINYIFSLPEKVQGVAWSDRTTYSANNGTLVLSQSYGLSNSHLLCFDYSSVASTAKRKYYREVSEGKVNFAYEGITTDQGIPFTNASLYVYFVDKNDDEAFLNDYSIPSMSEGMCSVTGFQSGSGVSKKIYVLFESAGRKYSAFTRTRLKNVYSFTPRAK